MRLSPVSDRRVNVAFTVKIQTVTAPLFPVRTIIPVQ